MSLVGNTPNDSKMLSKRMTENYQVHSPSRAKIERRASRDQSHNGSIKRKKKRKLWAATGNSIAAIASQYLS